MEPLNVYSVLGPAILAMIVFEFVYCLVRKNGYYSFQDSLIGMGTMIIAQCFNLMIAVLVVKVYGYFYVHFSLTQLPQNFWTYAICYVGVDFLFYWFHRSGHRVNLFWAAHVTHHSAEELNYAVALRTSFTQRAFSFLFYVPLAIMGFSPEIIVPVVALNLVFQFIPHTRVIPKLPSWIDSWLNTPYHHQVHHAANEIYWDKNYGGTFIFWDKMFGTYTDQTEPPFYGVSVHPKTWNPTFLTLHWYMVLWRDMKIATHWQDKIKLWFMPPGWRPRNLPPYDKEKWKDEATQIKYRTEAYAGSSPYLILQLVLSMILVLTIMSNQSPFSILQRSILSVILWIGITNWGGFLERKKWAIWSEALRIPVLTALLFSWVPAYGSAVALAGLISAGWMIWLFMPKEVVPLKPSV